jgi:hypothetical protein
VDFGGKKMAFSIRPESVSIRENLVPKAGMNLALGMVGQVQTHASSSAPTRPFPLPKLSQNSDSTNRLDLTIPLHLTYTELDRMITDALKGQTIRINKQYLFQPSNFRTKAFGDRLGIWMDFLATDGEGEDIAGELFLAGLPVFDAASKVLAFEKVEFALNSNSNKAKLGAMLKRGKISNQLNKRLRFSLDQVLSESLSGIANRMAIQTPYADFKLADLEVAPNGFYPTATGMDIRVQAKGRVDIRWK